MTSQNEEFAGHMLQQISEDEEFSENEERLTAFNTDPVSSNFLCHRRIEERDD